MSHSVSVRIEFKDKEALGRAVEAMGGRVFGEGTHYLYGGSRDGFGFQLKGWSYPCVLADGQVTFDDYNGRWGNRADLERLKAEYAIQAASLRCEQLGWMSERQENGSLRIYHPSGHELVVTPQGEVDAIGFQGQGCAAAVDAIAEVLGTEQARLCKPEYHTHSNELKQLL